MNKLTKALGALVIAGSAAACTAAPSAVPLSSAAGTAQPLSIAQPAAQPADDPTIGQPCFTLTASEQADYFAELTEATGAVPYFMAGEWRIGLPYVVLGTSSNLDGSGMVICMPTAP